MTYVSRPPMVENFHKAGFLVSQANARFSYDRVTIAFGSKYLSGTVMGKQTTGTTAAAAPLGTNTGNGTFGAITVGSGALPGTYSVEFDDPTHFVVSNPAGDEVGHGSVGSAFNAGGIGFVISAGGTAFAAGDSFAVTVAAGSGKWTACTLGASDGSQVAAGLLLGVADATISDVTAAMITRHVEINATELVWDASMNSAAQVAALTQLAALGIVSR